MMEEIEDLYNIKDVLEYQIFKYLRGTKFSYEELYQVAYLGYLKAKNNFDRSKCDKLSLTYVSMYIKQELKSYVQKEYKYHNNHIELKDDTMILDTIQEPRNHNSLNIIKKYVLKLSDIEQYVIHRTFLDKRPARLKDIASKLNVSKQRVHQIRKTSCNKLKKYLLEDGIYYEFFEE